MAVEHWKWIAGFNSFSQAALVTSPRPGIGFVMRPDKQVEPLFSCGS